MRVRAWVGIWVAALLGVGAALGQGGVDARLQPDIAALTVGDVVTFTLIVDHPAGWRVIVPDLPEQWGDYEVLSQGVQTIRENRDGSETTLVPIQVTLFATGSFATPPLEIKVVDPAGRSAPLVVAPYELTVRSVLREGDTALRDIKAQAVLAVPAVSPLVYGAVALAVVALVGVLRSLWRRRKANRPVIDNRTSYQKARDELARIEQLGLVDQGRYQEHYQMISDLLRELFESTYNFPATDLTTVEIKRWFTHMDLPLDFNRYAIDLLKDCDMVKFANMQPSYEAAQAVTARAHQLIFAMEPVPLQHRPGRVERVA